MRAYPLRPWEKLTFEYVLLKGVNDTDADAKRVVRLICKTELQGEFDCAESGAGHSVRNAGPERVESFQQIVRQAVPCFVRKPRGRDIFAACGQLKRVSGDLVGIGG